MLVMDRWIGRPVDIATNPIFIYATLVTNRNRMLNIHPAVEYYVCVRIFVIFNQTSPTPPQKPRFNPNVFFLSFLSLPCLTIQNKPVLRILKNYTFAYICVCNMCAIVRMFLCMY